MATDQRRYRLCLIALGILNEILNDASSDYQTLFTPPPPPPPHNSDESLGVLRSGEEEDGDIFPK